MVDQVLLAFAPFPTSKPAPVLPRYLMKLSQVETQNPDQSVSQSEQLNQVEGESSPPVEALFKSYIEGKLLNITGALADQHVIWLKPNIVAPLGYTLWAGGTVRKISVVPKADFLVQQKQFHLKTYQSDFLPLEKGKYHLFAKYDFKVPESHPELVMNLRVDVPADKYLLGFMRLKVVDKSKSARKYATQTEDHVLLDQTKVENLRFSPNGGKGYCLVVEGVMPYNTTEGQLQVEVLTNLSTFSLDDVQHVEPLEYADKFVPSKYGIIFKEKIFVGPDHTSAAIHITLKKEGKEFTKIEDMRRLFKVQILDHGKEIFAKEGFNLLTLSHVLFRSSH